MPLDVPAGETVFLDSTILHYAFVDFQPATAQCIHLLKRVTHREVTACVTVPVVHDAVHKVMCSEAKARFDQPRTGLVPWLKANPHRVRELTHATTVLRLLEAMPLKLLEVDLSCLLEAQEAVRSYGLLAGDALILAMMRRHRVVHLASNDNDFDGVRDLTVWKPRAQ